nr:hypothetical protein B0A51_08974 [Rachicladosporium sp. CCFEE 5018]
MLCAPCWRRVLQERALETYIAPGATRPFAGLSTNTARWRYGKGPTLRLRAHEPASGASRRPFHSSRRLSADPDALPNHYATLDLSITATTSEIKKQFYKLSKSYHPDLHPEDPNAKIRFLAISEAYTVLSSPTKRPQYDRNFLRATGPQTTSSAAGSPGGRPASGLSKRRSTFRGPPPSFHRSGGWGSHTQKRAEAASQPSHSHPAASTAPGTGPGSTAAGQGVPHFDHEQHTSTHSTIERTRHQARRKKFERRMEEAQEDVQGGSSALVNFLLVGGILGVVFAVPAVFFSGGRESGSGKKRGDG